MSFLDPEMPTVTVIDSDAAVREALDVLIRAAGWQPRMAASAEEFLARPRLMVPGCLLIELDLPGISGIELQRRIADQQEAPVIMMSGCADVPAVVQALKSGAIDFLTKPIDRDALLAAIREAVDRSHAALRRSSRVEALQHRFESLSRREREVMSLVVTGRLNKQVGGELGISEITVKAHRGSLMRKMQAGSFAELVKMASSLGQGAAPFAN